MSETKQNYDRKPSYSALRSSLIEFIGSMGHGASDGKQLSQLSFHVAIRLK